jgi:hypothetical protein
MSAKKILAISTRQESYDDFVNIGKRVNRLDSSIIVSVNNGSFDTSQLPLHLHHLPLLTLYMVNPPNTLPLRGHTLCVKDLGKLEEYKNFAAAGVLIPRAKPYQLGETVDPGEWGEYVILKPTHDSLGRGVVLIQTSELKKISIDTIPVNHPLGKVSYILQEFIDPGPLMPGYRVMSLMGQPLLSYCWDNVTPAQLPNSFDDSFSRFLFAAAENERVRKLVIEEDIIEFAQQVFEVHADLPLQGIDIIRDAQTKQLYVLENNSGGNVWSFSMSDSNPYRSFGRKAMVTQFMAFDRAAEILVRKTHELAC